MDKRLPPELRCERLALGISQSNMSARLRMKPGRLGHIERGELEPPDGFVNRYRDALRRHRESAGFQHGE